MPTEDNHSYVAKSKDKQLVSGANKIKSSSVTNNVDTPKKDKVFPRGYVLKKMESGYKRNGGARIANNMGTLKIRVTLHMVSLLRKAKRPKQ